MEDSRTIMINLRETDHIKLFGLPSTITDITHAVPEQYPGRQVLVSKKDESSQTQKLRAISVATLSALPPTNDADVHVTNSLLFDEMKLEKRLKLIAEEADSKPKLSSLVMERVLSSNTVEPFFETTKKLRIDPFSANITFSFLPKVLSSLKENRIGISEVTAISQNPTNSSLLAVGYSSSKAGWVCVWSLKNSKNAERIHRCSAPVSCLQFSKALPSFLALGFYDGKVSVANIIPGDLQVSMDFISQLDKKLNFKYVANIIPGDLQIIHHIVTNSYKPVCCVQWWETDSIECLIYTTDTEVFNLRPPFLSSTPKSLIAVAHILNEESVTAGGYKGGIGLQLMLGPAILCISRRPNVISRYVIGCADGYIRECSTESSEHKEIKYAHLGVVNAIKHSANYPKVYLTCGSDGSVRIWTHNQKEPLIVLETEIPGVNVIDACWSPTHATIIVGIVIDGVCVWDLRRKRTEPLSFLALPAEPTVVEVGELTMLLGTQFSSSGDFLFIGLKDGTIMLIGIEGLPAAENFKSDAILSAISTTLHQQRRKEMINILFDSNI